MPISWFQMTFLFFVYIISLETLKIDVWWFNNKMIGFVAFVCAYLIFLNVLQQIAPRFKWDYLTSKWQKEKIKKQLLEKVSQLTLWEMKVSVEEESKIFTFETELWNFARIKVVSDVKIFDEKRINELPFNYKKIPFQLKSMNLDELVTVEVPNNYDKIQIFYNERTNFFWEEFHNITKKRFCDLLIYEAYLYILDHYDNSTYTLAIIEGFVNDLDQFGNYNDGTKNVNQELKMKNIVNELKNDR